MTKTTKTTTAAGALALALGALALGMLAAARSNAAPNPAPGEAQTLRTSVLRSNELPGYVMTNCPIVQADPTAWGGTDAASLRRERFSMGIREHLRANHGGATVVSAATRFSSTDGAEADFTRRLARLRHTYRFSVRGIPGAVGYRTAHGTTYGVIFTVGPTEHLVAVLAPAPVPASLEQGILRAARAVHARTTA
jgi:hypothetical protein